MLIKVLIILLTCTIIIILNVAKTLKKEAKRGRPWSTHWAKRVGKGGVGQRVSDHMFE